MTRAYSHHGQSVKLVGLLVPMCLISPQIAFAQAEPRAVVDVSVNGTADSNPFLETNGVSTVSATLQVDPKVYWSDETSNVVLDAGMRISQYSRQYGNDIGAHVGVQARKQLNARTSLSSSAGFRSSRSTLQDFILGNVDQPLDAVIFPQVPLTDVTVAGRRVRVKTLDASVGLDHTLSDNDSISLSGFTALTRFGSATDLDYRTGEVGLRYRRRLSERTNVTAGATFGLSDYIGVSEGDARIITPQIGIENQISERLSWTANAGVSFASVDDASGRSRSEKYLAGAFSLCDRGPSATLCGSVSRSAQPTAFGGISAVSNVAFSLQKQLNQKDQFSLSGRYGRTDQNSNFATPAMRRESELFGASATYTRNLNERLALFVTPSFTKITEKPVRSESNYSATIGIRMRFGKLR